VEFDEKIKQLLLSGNHERLIRYLGVGKEAVYAVPTQDNYLPLNYAIGLRRKEDSLEFIHEGFQHGEYVTEFEGARIFRKPKL
jgi:4,5-DOPA dioxygenase extradiol